ncbi:uncharacterized protein METZ01_LOCUS12482 [marine metagenome]|uniref:Uncharacterized protein n=1 Tax=marine metagenome TaxID=408172 RepID=A0A381P0D5_9ZZZZ
MEAPVYYYESAIFSIIHTDWNRS